MKILLCYDANENSEKTVRFAVEKFAHLKPSILLFSVTANALDASVESESMTEDNEKERRKALLRMVLFLGASSALRGAGELLQTLRRQGEDTSQAAGTEPVPEEIHTGMGGPHR